MKDNDFQTFKGKTMTNSKKTQDTSFDESSQEHGFDALAFNLKLQELFIKSQKIFAEKSINHFTSGEKTNFDPFGLTKLYANFWTKLAQNPEIILKSQQNYMEQYFKLLNDSYKKLQGEATQEIITHEKGDRRFKSEEWDNSAYFSFVKQSYLLFAQSIFDGLNQVDDLDPQTKKRLDFFTKQFLDALAPSNFVLTNPSVLKETVDTNGENLIQGFHNLLEDFSKGEGLFQLSTVDKSAFEVGKNLATTDGDVIYRNDLIELIHYKATSDKVHKTPLLIIPPWINKFYILDLQEKNSFIKWLTEQGHDVFCISWVNPDETLAKKTFEAYLDEGLLTAIDIVKKYTGEDQINAMGYCLGGTLLSCGLSILSKKKDTSIKSATFLTTLIDFSDAGDMLVFIDEDQLATTEELMKTKGFYPAENLKQTFSLMRSNDMVWSFFVNNYLLGRSPMPFDLLYWNDDSTNMPYAMHLFYLREMYLKNNIVKKNTLEMLGHKIDLSKIETPCFFLSTKEDHIAPWKSTYLGPQNFSSDKIRFVLAESGHIAGVINHPDNNKYGYWTNDKLPDNSEEWFNETKHHQGSWWPYWNKWMKDYKDEKTRPFVKDHKEFPSLCKAPGTYVLEKK